jgi:hypothetical protein
LVSSSQFPTNCTENVLGQVELCQAAKTASPHLKLVPVRFCSVGKKEKQGRKRRDDKKEEDKQCERESGQNSS